jgi:putative ATPase
MQPLAAQIRPQNLDNFIGQEHLVGPGKPLLVAIEMEAIFSMIFWGPPGSGKTTLARIIAAKTNRQFIEMSAVNAGKADIRKVVEASRGQRQLGQDYSSPILFIDEIHRFNKVQQDFLLPYVEDGTMILIGATTENPSFEVISPLLSRTRVFVLKSLTKDQLSQVVDRAIKEIKIIAKREKNSQLSKLKIAAKARDWLLNFANGDARKLLTIIDNCIALYFNLKLESLKNALQSQHISYDKKGEEHYNTISAFIKSMRASNPDAAVYYLARMVEAGEDPLFIARRMVIFASEDIGMAQPTALVVANEVFKSCQVIGYPECAITLAHGVVYLARAKKDRSAYNALRAAQADVLKYGNLEIPFELRNAPTDLMKNLGYGKGYEQYPAKDKSLLPEELKKKKYYLSKK